MEYKTANVDKDQIAIETKACFERVFRSTDGEEVLRTLADHCVPEMGIYEPDHNRVIFNEGKRYMFFLLLRAASIPMADYLKQLESSRAQRETDHLLRNE